MSENLPLPSTESQQKTTKPRELDNVAKETLMAILAHKTLTKAAEVLGINRTTLYERIEKYKLRPIIDGAYDKALLALLVGSVEAAENLTEKINHRDPNISLRASTEILDRVGITNKSSQQQINITSENMNVEFLSHEPES